MTLASSLLFVACLAPGVRQLPAEEVLASARAAVGTRAMAAIGEGVLVSGTCRQAGVDGTFDFLFDGHGRLKHQVHSRLGEVLAFDGETAWGRDPGGVVRRLSFGARVSTQGWLWVQNGTWLDSEGPMRATRLAGGDTPANEIALRLERIDEPWEARLYLDAETSLPARMVRRRSAGERTYRFDDWREVLGFRYPHVVEIEDVAGDVSRYETRSVTRAPAFFRDPFAPLFQRPTDATFDSEVAAELDARRMDSGHLLVRPLVNGLDVGWFILDSGASSLCIDPQVADRLGMEAFGEITVVGAGGAHTGRFRAGALLRAGPIQLPDMPWLELELGFLEDFFDVPVAGVLGYELFARAVVSLDLAHGRVEVHDPAHFKLEGDWQELRFDDRLPCVEVAFEGDRREWFRLDTGSSDSVSFHGPAVERLGLLEGRRTVGAIHTGVGGHRKARSGKLAWLELGGRRFEDYTVTFSLASESALATPYTTGNLGGELLRHFKVVFDYGAERIAFLALDDR